MTQTIRAQRRQTYDMSTEKGCSDVVQQSPRTVQSLGILPWPAGDEDDNCIYQYKISQNREKYITINKMEIFECSLGNSECFDPGTSSGFRGWGSLNQLYSDESGELHPSNVHKHIFIAGFRSFRKKSMT
ncbi:hypothetical protein TNCV_2457311 [Trichonephila clavipes]|nr:hypothetical protein TNCV_2457311 [Trichonephila clavipes]